VISVIMPTIFWSGTFDRCVRRLLALVDRSAAAVEVIVAFDGVAPPAPAWLDRPGVTIVETGVRSGPAMARNLAAHSARGEILFFVDSDVELAEDAIDRVIAAFSTDPDMVGLFGAYDDEPVANGLVGVFRNLLHHHTHVTHPGRVSTFWSGCGAIRTSTFLDAGGFDETSAHWNVEDVELGMRIAADGGKIMLIPEVQCKNLRRWTMASIVVSDIVRRVTPWTHLLVVGRNPPSVFNLDWRSRLSGICALLLVACLGASLLMPATLWAAVACVQVVTLLNLDFYRLCTMKRGIGFAALAVSLHILFFAYASLTCGAVLFGMYFRPGPPGYSPVSLRC